MRTGLVPHHDWARLPDGKLASSRAANRTSWLHAAGSNGKARNLRPGSGPEQDEQISATLARGYAVTRTSISVGRPIPDPRQPRSDPLALPFRGDQIHGRNGYPHGLGARLEVAERGVGRAEGVHQHDRPRGPVPLGFVDGRGRTVEQLVTECPRPRPPEDRETHTGPPGDVPFRGCGRSMRSPDYQTVHRPSPPPQSPHRHGEASRRRVSRSGCVVPASEDPRHARTGLPRGQPRRSRGKRPARTGPGLGCHRLRLLCFNVP